MSNTGGGFDASDEAGKVAAPPLAALTPPLDPTAMPIPTNHQPTDGIGVSTTRGGQVVHGLGTWTAAGGTTNPAPVFKGSTHPVQQAGTQAIDTSKP